MPILNFVTLEKIPRQDFRQQPSEFRFQSIQFYSGRISANEVRHLAVQATPIAGVVGIEVDADGKAAGPARKNRIDIGQPGFFTAMICRC